MPRRAWIAIVAAACLTAAGCPSGCDAAKKLVNPTGTSVQSVSVTPLAVQLTVGQTVQFTATVSPTSVPDRSVAWTVSPLGIATIDNNGMLTGVAAGQVIVTATTVAKPTHTAEAIATVVAQ